MTLLNHSSTQGDTLFKPKLTPSLKAVAAALVQVAGLNCAQAQTQTQTQAQTLSQATAQERKTVSVASALSGVGAAINSNAFSVGRPASATRALARANGQHPAILVTHQARYLAIDPNRFIVQPPVQVSWTVQPGPGADISD